MIQWILTSSILILIVAALRFALRGKISPRLQYALWILVLLRLLIPVSFGATGLSVMNALPDNAAALLSPLMSAGIPEGAYTKPDGAAVPADPYPSERDGVAVRVDVGPVTNEAHRVIDWGDILKAVWLSGAALMALWLAAANLRFSARLRRSRRELPISGGSLPVYVSEMIDAPCLFGLARPAIYVTPAVAENGTVLRHSVEHERTHYRHLDHLWAFLRGVCLALHWYDPLVWLAAALSRRDAELACDEATIRRMGEGERTEYGRTLIGLTCRKRTALLLAATTMTESPRGIKERIALIAKKPRTAIYTLIAVIFVAALAAGCTFTGAREEAKAAPVFTRIDETSYITVDGPLGETLVVGDDHFGELLEWVGAFTLGERRQDVDLPVQGANLYTVTLTYADGTTESSGIDIAVRDGVAYYIARPDLPECWSELWGGNRDVEALIITALNSDGAYAESANWELLCSLTNFAPVETLEAVGAREEGIRDFLCWTLAYELKQPIAQGLVDDLPQTGLSEDAIAARDMIAHYAAGDYPAPKSWRQVYLDFWEETLPELSEDSIAALGLFDTHSDGVPELAVWYESSADGVLYYTDGAAVYHNIGSIYEGAPPEGALIAREDESIGRGELNAFLNSWYPYDALAPFLL